ncbi:pentapeptide repeat-containing protein [Nostoc sp. 2RC]|uniref:pentapeptide repeat-containing protein n=1 Tax=Nostoc sp. 2RC TaxID=2485484 RepID=UPI0021AB1831|nr:pentapeptide repeat-containing protein [Nostoc sp. 2RC]
MNLIVRPFIAVMFILAPSLINQGNDLLRRHIIQHLQETRKCFGCNLSRVNFSKANLQGIDLRSANLQGAKLKNANLRYANLEWADLREVNLQGADLTGANLKNSLLTNANLQQANLQHSNLQGTDFRNANLSYANLSQTSKNNDIQNRNSVILCKTVMPNGIRTNHCYETSKT